METDLLCGQSQVVIRGTAVGSLYKMGDWEYECLGQLFL